MNYKSQDKLRQRLKLLRKTKYLKGSSKEKMVQLLKAQHTADNNKYGEYGFIEDYHQNPNRHQI